jgi:hypothetical protein
MNGWEVKWGVKKFVCEIFPNSCAEKMFSVYYEALKQTT